MNRNADGNPGSPDDPGIQPGDGDHGAEDVLYWIGSDPCHGCRHAVRRPDKEVDGIFERRLACKLVDRRNELVELAYRILGQNRDAATVKKAYDLLDTVVSGDKEFTEKGHYPCDDSIAPWCYEPGGED